MSTGCANLRAHLTHSQLVDEPVLEQRLDEVRAAVHLELGTVLLLQRTDRGRDLALEQL
jgi:hypothetical protein